MKTPARSFRLPRAFLAVLGVAGLLLAAPPARAQSAASTFTPALTVGLVGTTPPPGSTGPERIACAGLLKVSTTAIPDPALGPTMVVNVDARGLVCFGLSTRARYVSTGHAILTRPLAATDLVETTFALHRDVPDGYLDARTALLTLNLAYNTVTGALATATARVGNP